MIIKGYKFGLDLRCWRLGFLKLQSSPFVHVAKWYLAIGPFYVWKLAPKLREIEAFVSRKEKNTLKHRFS